MHVFDVVLYPQLGLVVGFAFQHVVPHNLLVLLEFAVVLHDVVEDLGDFGEGESVDSCRHNHNKSYNCQLQRVLSRDVSKPDCGLNSG